MGNCHGPVSLLPRCGEKPHRLLLRQRLGLAPQAAVRHINRQLDRTERPGERSALQRPAGAGTRLSGAAGCLGGPSGRRRRRQRLCQHAGPWHSHGFRLLESDRRLRNQPAPDSLFRRVHLRTGLLGRPAQHASRRCDLHSARDRRGLRGRRRPPVAELAHVPVRGPVYERLAQYAAAAAAAVLVQCGAEDSAGPAAVDEPGRPRLSQQSRAVPARARHASAGGVVLRRDRIGCGRSPRVSNVGAATSGAHGRAVPRRPRVGGVAHRVAGDRRRRLRRALRDRCRRDSAASI